MRNIKIIVLLVVMGAAGFVALRHFGGAGGMNPAAGGAEGFGAPPVNVAAVVQQDVQIWREFSGRLAAVDAVEIRPRVAGEITGVHFTNGAMVEKGAPLFTIDPAPYEAEVARAESVLASAKAQLKLAEDGLARATRLIKDKAIPQHEFDSRNSAALVARANVKTAEAALETARLNLGYTNVTAPIAGKAGRAEITLGNLVGVGQPVLTTVVSSNPIYADFEVDETTYLQSLMHSPAAGDAAKIPVKMELATEEGTPHEGWIEAFDNRISSATGTIRARAVFENPEGALLPGMFARIALGSAATRPALLITERAVGTDQNQKFVLVVGEDKVANYCPVTLGSRANGLVVVESGLQPGETIIIGGVQRARPGTPATPELVPMDAPEMPAGQQAAPEQKAAEAPAAEELEMPDMPSAAPEEHKE